MRTETVVFVCGDDRDDSPLGVLVGDCMSGKSRHQSVVGGMKLGGVDGWVRGSPYRYKSNDSDHSDVSRSQGISV